MIEILGISLGHPMFNSIGNAFFIIFPPLFFSREERVLEICSNLDLRRLLSCLYITYIPSVSLSI